MKTYTKRQVAATIDHAVLKPEYTDNDIKEHARMCIENGVFSMCVRPCDIRMAVDLLKDSSVKVSCVLSFPHGADSTEVKVCQAIKAIEDGVDEIDMVMNIGKFLSDDQEYVRNDIKAVVDIAHNHNVRVKVIQESCYLSLEQVAEACRLSLEAGADFVKTSTGFGTGSATPEIVEVMIATVGDKMGVKASGGIRTWESAVSYLEQGASRLGIGSTLAVLSGAPNENNSSIY